MEDLLNGVNESEVNADLNTDIDQSGSVNENVVDEGDQQPEIDANPEDQSKNKDNPANHAFAEMRRKNKELETQLQKLTQQQKEKDEYYANLARQAGRTDIQTEEQYRKAVKLQDLSEKYKETNDPLILAEIIKESGIVQPQQPQQTYIDTGLDKEVEEFNKEFKGALKSIDDILTLPNSEKIVGYMQSNGLTLSDAYKLANPDKIAAATKQAAINQAKGFTHVKSNNNGGNVDTVTVSANDIANWKRFFPGKTDEQCRKEIIANKKLLED